MNAMRVMTATIPDRQVVQVGKYYRKEMPDNHLTRMYGVQGKLCGFVLSHTSGDARLYVPGCSYTVLVSAHQLGLNYCEGEWSFWK